MKTDTRKKMTGEDSKDVSLLQNIRRVNRTLFRTYPETVWVTPIYILCRVLLPFLTAVIPSVAISAITKGDVRSFLVSISVILFLELVTYIVLDLSNMLLMNRRVYTRLRIFFLDYVRKSLATDYANLEPSKCQAEFTRGAKAVVGNQYGPEQLMGQSVHFLVQLLGVLTFGGAVICLDYRIMLILLFTFVLDLVLRGYAVRYDNEHRMILSEIHRKQEYLEQGSLTLAAGKDVRVYQMEGWFHQITEKLLADAMQYLKKSGLRWYIPSLGNQVCVAAQEIVTYLVLVAMVLSGEISVAEFTLQLGIVRGFSQWIDGVSVSYGALQKANGEMNDYLRVLKKTDSREAGEAEVPKISGAPEIEFRDVCFRYPMEEADTLSHVSFHIKAGEKIALVGNNGAGKTTLVKLLCGLYKPTSGKIYINGTDITTYKTAEYQKLISVVFQDVSLLSFTVEMNVAGVYEEQADEERVRNVLQQVGLGDKIEKLPHGIKTYITQDLDEEGIQFSGGETQRLLLARAMYRNGPIMILDEPTSALDPIAESNLYQEYNRLTKEKTSLFISHRLASTKFCDRIVLLDKGQIAEVGTHEELMEKQGIYKELFDIQSHYYKDGEVVIGEC